MRNVPDLPMWRVEVRRNVPDIGIHHQEERAPMHSIIESALITQRVDELRAAGSRRRLARAFGKSRRSEPRRPARVPPGLPRTAP